MRGRSGGLTMGVAVQTDMALPPILKFGSDEQKQEWAAPAIAGQKILALGITEPDAGSDVAGIRTRAVYDSANDEYVINGSKTYITNGHRADLIVLVTKTDSNSNPHPDHMTASPSSWYRWICREWSERSSREARNACLGHRAARFPGRARACNAVLGDVGKGFYQIMWELQGERLISCAAAVASAQELFDRTLVVRQAACGVRPADRQVPDDPPQVRGDGNEDRDGAPARPTPRPGAARTASTRCARSRWRSCTPRGSRARWQMIACRSTAAPVTCVSTGSSGPGATCG